MLSIQKKRIKKPSFLFRIIYLNSIEKTYKNIIRLTYIYSILSYIFVHITIYYIDNIFIFNYIYIYLRHQIVNFWNILFEHKI